MSTLLEEQVIPDQLRQAQRGVRRRLEIIRRRLRMHLLVEGVFWVVMALIAAAAASLILDRLIRFNLTTRLGLLAIVVVAIAVLAALKLVRPLLLPLDDLDLAELLNRRSPGVGQQISNVLQLPELLRFDPGASPSMVQAAVIECASSLDRVDLAATLNVARRRKLLAACAALVALAAGFWASSPQTASLWARRWLAGSTVRWPQDNYLNIVGLGDDGELLVPRGELSLLQINARPEFAAAEGHWILGGRGEPLVVEGTTAPTSQPPPQVGVSYVLADGSKRRGNAAQFDEANFRYELPPLGDKIELSLTGGDDWLGPITIVPVDRPTAGTFEITSRRPGGEPKTEQVGEASGQLLYLPETELQLRLIAKEPLKSAEALDKGSPVAGWQRVDERIYTLNWTMQESRALEFRLIGEQGALSSKPYFLTIGLLKDREPRVTISSHGVGRRVTPVARIPLSVRANDDFGVASLALDWERTAIYEEKPKVETKREDLEKPPRPEAELPARTEINLDYELSLRERGFAPGNTLKLRGVAADACAQGSQSGNSRWLAFQVVASDELFYEILMRQREQRAKFAAALENAKAQSKALTELAQPQDALGISRAEQVIARQVWQVANQLDASLQEMTLNDLGNAQARENLQSAIIAPMRKLHADLLTRLRTAVDGLSQQSSISEDRRAEAIAISDQAVEVMQSILGQMSLWESFIDVINQLKQIIDRQGQVLKSTEEIEKQRTNELFDK
jgi:hypothetical protein